MAISGFRHKGLERFFCRGTTAGIQAPHAKRLTLILASLSIAEQLGEMGLPGYNLHPLKGDLRLQMQHDLWHAEQSRKRLKVRKLAAA